MIALNESLIKIALYDMLILHNIRRKTGMEKGNVLVIGNSGVGKSTLINAVLGEDVAVTGYGPTGTTKELTIYESNDIPFRVIDTVGFEPSWFSELEAINSVKRWSKNSAKAGKEDSQINVIWFCVDGTSRKLFPKAIKDLSRATSMWPSIPVVVVITKSYSVPERKQNIEMVHHAFAKQKRYSKNLKKVIPVVASTYVLNESAYAAPEGITDLIDITHGLLPEGIKAAENDVAAFKLNRKRALSHSIVGIATAGATVVGAVSIPFSDAVILAPVELAEVNSLAQIYGINKNEGAKKFLNSIVEVGTVGTTAKIAIDTLKAIPGINIAADVINAIIAGSIVFALGEGSIYAFEQIYLGNKTVDDIDWVKKIIESKLSNQFIEKVKETVDKIGDTVGDKSIAKIILDVFNTEE